MLATAFPDLQWLKKQADTAFENRRSPSGEPLPSAGWPNVIMNATASRIVRDNIRGPLSVFSNRSGASTVSTAQKRVTLQPGVFFITNDDEHYTLEIGKQVTETANIHFGQSFMRTAFRSMTDDAALLLDEPDGHVPSFHNRVVPINPTFQQVMESLMIPGKEAIAEEEQLFQLLSLLTLDEQRLRARQEALTAMRHATREEIMRRLLRATDYLYSTPDAQPDLDELARISCLSKFHFLRLFSIAFRQTPHQFITTLKIKRAEELLKSSTTEIKHIALSLGFKDASTFSRLFHRTLGVYPSQYRAQA
jgi:AraC family transcriptional regulator